MKHQHAQTFTCPMHTEVISDKPGNCPKCGMSLVPADENTKREKTRRSEHGMTHKMHNSTHDTNTHTGHAGHDHHAMIEDFKKRFYVVLVLTGPIMLLSQMIQHWLNIHFNFQGSHYVLLLLSSIVFFYGGLPFLRGWLDEMKTWKPGMMTLIGFAITVAYVYSVATIFGLKGMDFFWELTTLILIMLLGHWIEMKSVAGASRELELLVQLMPSEAHLVHDGGVTDVKTETLKENNIVLIKPGEKVPADGLITEGESSLNESMLTGESKPVEKKKNDKVIAGSINGNGSLKISVLHSSKDSYLAQVIKLVQDAQQSKSKTQLLADKAAQWLPLLQSLPALLHFLHGVFPEKIWHFLLNEW